VRRAGVERYFLAAPQTQLLGRTSLVRPAVVGHHGRVMQGIFGFRFTYFGRDPG
jgi:hypothetical protein